MLELGGCGALHLEGERGDEEVLREESCPASSLDVQQKGFARSPVQAASGARSECKRSVRGQSTKCPRAELQVAQGWLWRQACVWKCRDSKQGIIKKIHGMG